MILLRWDWWTKMTRKYYVSMTDRFMSGWGMAENKTNKLVLECDTYQEAEIVYNNAIKRPEMKYINICINKPYYNPSRYYVSEHNKTDYSTWFKKGAWENTN
jgi:hypothetical protein